MTTLNEEARKRLIEESLAATKPGSDRHAKWNTASTGRSMSAKLH